MEVSRPNGAHMDYKKFKRLLKKKASLGIAVAPLSHSSSSSFNQSTGELNEAVAFSSWCSWAGEPFTYPNHQGHDEIGDLVDDVSSVVVFCKDHARKILRRRFAAGFRKPLVILGMMKATRLSSVKEGSYLVSYAAFNALAIRKMEGRVAQVWKLEFQAQSSGERHSSRTRLSSLHAELLQSPLLLELIASHEDRRSVHGSKPLPLGFQEFACDFDGVKPTLSCVTLDSFRLDFELACSICLDTFFCPTALSCGHIFCYSCACSTASVPAFQGLELAKRSARCPLCRQTGVYQDATELPELSALIKHRCNSYWRERSQRERSQQLQEMKAYYNHELRAALGYCEL